MSQFWWELFKQARTQLCLSTAYHPETDGQTEVLNKGVETYLRCFTSDRPDQWASWLPWVEYWYNTTHQGSANMTPFKALYGKDPPTFLKLTNKPSVVEEVNEQIRSRNAIIATLKDNLLKAQEEMWRQANKHRRDVQFDSGEQVYVRIQPYRMRTLVNHCNTISKLSP